MPAKLHEHHCYHPTGKHAGDTYYVECCYCNKTFRWTFEKLVHMIKTQNVRQAGTTHVTPKLHYGKYETDRETGRFIR